MPDPQELTNVPLTVAAAQVLLHWLTVVPDDVVPVTHPADRQALAEASGEWISRGPIHGGSEQGDSPG